IVFLQGAGATLSRILRPERHRRAVVGPGVHVGASQRHTRRQAGRQSTGTKEQGVLPAAEAVPPRALRLPLHADRPQLVKLLLQRRNRPNNVAGLRSLPRVRQAVCGQVHPRHQGRRRPRREERPQVFPGAGFPHRIRSEGERYEQSRHRYPEPQRIKLGSRLFVGT
ncbi:unnamed protein product, partial [Ixodes pacificus]